MQIIMEKNHGFTLVEIAIVLVIVGLLLAGLIVPLTVQKDLRDYDETRKELAEYREALIGYALSNSAADGGPYLPCPDTDSDGFENRIGTTCAAAAGNVPWATLGIDRADNWNNIYLYRVTLAYADSNAGFTLATLRDNNILDAAGGNIIASAIPAVLCSKGKNGFGAGPDELENSIADANFVSHVQANAIGNEFDDLVAWLPSAVLFNRLVAAGRLP